VALTDASSRALATKIDHIVVLMLENRSFDHMLGYLSLPPELQAASPGDRQRLPIDGLRDGLANTHAGVVYPVHHLDRTTLRKAEDPDHSEAGIREQLSNANGGFVDCYVRTRNEPVDPGTVMGYFNADDVPMYDFLARRFCVCDHWFSSVPGHTWDNRVYAVSGREADALIPRAPLYAVPTFLRLLPADAWRWYSTDPATLRLIDPHYRLGPDRNFAFFDRRTLFEQETFFDDIAAERLPALSWIDPNFVDLSGFGPPGSSDDHPPSDIHAGQELALRVYTALASSPLWERTLLLVTYDEHGGFYDHVAPPVPVNPTPRYPTYGVRVPALVASPWVPAGQPSSTVFDHTSIIATVLARFVPSYDGKDPDLGPRVAVANDLGALLTLDEPRPAEPVPDAVIDAIAHWRLEGIKRALRDPVRGLPSVQAGDGEPLGLLRIINRVRNALGDWFWRRFGRRVRVPRSHRPPASHLHEPTHLQEEIFEAAKDLRRRGLPYGRP
jgi:phospholipase C